ncbi:hypothetical protein [Kitasatospora sp. NPDC059160]|uniref:hypothetical protein n=1 Tax=Kitasatospora sp. NPDC059160 TaxID=3346748 RepID=UPI0036792737
MTEIAITTDHDVIPEAAGQFVADFKARLESAFAPLFATMEWAEEEIQEGQARHGERGQKESRIWRESFALVKPTHDRLSRAEMLYRAHAAELINRVATGQDTRPGTTAEMIAVLMDSSAAAPLNSAAVCLYMRLFSRAFPEQFAQHIAEAIELDAYESVHGRRADEYEAEMRHKLAQEWRVTKDQQTPKAPARRTPLMLEAPAQLMLEL